MKQKKVRLFIGLATILLVYGIDQLVKYIVTDQMELGSSMEIVGPFHLTYVQNTGAAFSLFAGNPAVLAVFSGLALIVIVFFMYKFSVGQPGLPFALAILAGGATGNLVDRIFRGYVVDYLDVGFWPVFNLADVAIVLSCAGLVFLTWKKEKSRSG